MPYKFPKRLADDYVPAVYVRRGDRPPGRLDTLAAIAAIPAEIAFRWGTRVLAVTPLDAAGPLR